MSVTRVCWLAGILSGWYHGQECYVGINIKLHCPVGQLSGNWNELKWLNFFVLFNLIVCGDEETFDYNKMYHVSGLVYSTNSTGSLLHPQDLQLQNKFSLSKQVNGTYISSSATDFLELSTSELNYLTFQQDPHWVICDSFCFCVSLADVVSPPSASLAIFCSRALNHHHESIGRNMICDI